MDAESTARVRGSSRSEEERAFLQQRLALLWKVVFLVALGTDVIEVLVDPGSLGRTGAHLDRLSTLFFGLLWLLCRSGRRSWGVMLAVEWAGLAVVLAVITLAGRFFAAEAIADLAARIPGTDAGSLAHAQAADANMSVSVLLGGAMIFVLRAALVPSPPLRSFALTSLLGLAFVFVPFFFAPAAGGAPPLRTADFPVVGAVTYAIWWAVVTAGAAVISHVVYGLRTEVRRARRLGQYTLEAKIGEGGMGVVYRAHHGMMRRPTAIKLLRPDKAVEANLKRFEREVQLTARLTHPHTITIFDYGRTPDGVFYYAMELLDGASLERVVQVAGRLGPARVVHVLYEVAGALVEARRRSHPPRHQAGEHHPVPRGPLRLPEDRGLPGSSRTSTRVATRPSPRRRHRGDAALHRTGGGHLAGLGEPRFGPARWGRSAAALTGQDVFQGRTLVEVCSHHLHTEPEPPSKRLGVPLPADLEAMVLDCLQKDPARRPTGARDLRRRLEACAAFGGWTEDAARAWWEEHAAAIAPAAGGTLDDALTLTRRLDSPA
jgi:serine/threonine-protein kinase